MLIVMRHGATEDEVRRVIAVIEEMGYQARPMPGAQRTAVGLVGNDGRVDASRLEGLPGVQEVIHVSKPYKQVSREWKTEPTVVRLPGGGGGVQVGGTDVVAIAGPCSVETERQIVEAARLVKDAGFEPVVVGPLARARLFDVGTAVYTQLLTADELRARLGL